MKIALAVLFLAAVGLAVWEGLRKREPVYQGRRLSEWTEALTAPLSTEFDLALRREHEKRQRAAEEAVQAIGPKAVPTLLRMVKARNSALEYRLQEWAHKHGIWKVRLVNAYEKHLQAKRAFTVLGSRAKVATRDLIRICESNPDWGCRGCAAAALAAIGPSASEALPILLREATNTESLAGLRSEALYALPKVCPEPGLIIPTLTNTLRDNSGQFRAEGAQALARLGPAARPALPALLVLLNDGKGYVRETATNALMRIDPIAAASAGVDTNAPSL